MDFLNYLATHYGFPKSQYLTVVEAGTEPFIGTSVTLDTTQYNITLNISGGTPGSTSELSRTVKVKSTSQTTTLSTQTTSASHPTQSGKSMFSA
jgi:xyloglucan-specific endo-beta-1,4-glucanase